MNARRAKKLWKKMNYAAGPTGYGPIPGLVRKPPPKLSRSEKTLLTKGAYTIEMMKKDRQGCWRDAVKEVTGEDVDMLGFPPDRERDGVFDDYHGPNPDGVYREVQR